MSFRGFVKAAVVGLVLGVGSLAGPGLAQAAGDAELGAKVFRKCKACHVVDSDKNKVGPNLQGLFGRTAGTVEGYKYSKAMADSSIVWDDATLAEFLKKPKAFIKGTKMTFAGVKKDGDLANLITYLKDSTQ